MRSLRPLLVLLATLIGVNTRDSRPNIILVLTDDQDVELGSLEFMPRLHDHVAREGATYSHGYVTTPMCCPSRSSLLTGLYVHNHQVFTNNENCSSLSWQQGHEKRTFAPYLQSSGYLTAYMGKYLNKYDGGHIPPGWSKWLGLVRNSRYYNYTLNNNGHLEHHRDDYHRDYLPDLITNTTIDLIHKMRHNSAPFMAVLGYPAPHGPEDAAPQYQDLFHNVTSHHTPAYNLAPNPDKQWILRHTEKMLPIHKTFTDVLMTKRLQTLQSVDVAVERIVKALRATGQLDNTYIFYTSDHGYHLGQFGLVKGKAFPYDFDTHVPFFVRGPGIKANTVRDQPVLNIDLAPTFLDIAGVTPPPTMDGKSILGTFKKQNMKIRSAFLIERGKMSHKRYATVSTLGNDVDNAATEDGVSLTKRQKYLNRKMEAECRKDKYQLPCLKDQNWVCRKEKNGSWKIKQCQRKKEECSCPEQSVVLTRRSRSLTNPTAEEIAALGSVVLDLANQISHLKTKEQPSQSADHLAQQDSWFSSKSVIKKQIQQLRAQLNELKQIRKYLRMRRPAVGVPVEEARPRNVVEETLSRLKSRCSCPPQERRRVGRSGDRRLRKLRRMMEKERRRNEESPAETSRKQDHCMADVKMNCFSHDNDHWSTPPVWTEGSFCACTNSNNNTYWCVRNINATHNYLYCEYVTGMITYSDLNQDKHQLRNLLYSLTDSQLSYLHSQLRDLKTFSGANSADPLPSSRRSTRRRQTKERNIKWRKG